MTTPSADRAPFAFVDPRRAYSVPRLVLLETRSTAFTSGPGTDGVFVGFAS